MSLFQCTERKRANPIDPLNPETGGRPVGIEIFSEFNNITISWSPVKITNLKGYNLYRKVSGQNSYHLLQLVSADSSQYNDQDVIYDQGYAYRISAVTPDYESPLSDSVTITPGPTVIWATDVDNRRIIKISHDGIHEIRRYPVDGYPWDIVIDPADRSIWYSDVLSGYIYHLKNYLHDIYFPISLWSEPVDIALDSQRNIVWVANDRGNVFRITPILADSIQEITHDQFKSPYAVAVSQASGNCWVADPVANEVFILSSSAEMIRSCSVKFSHPLSLTIDESDGSCWVADSNRVVKLNQAGILTLSINEGFQYAYALDINQKTGELWIIDIGSNHVNPQLIKIDQQGNVLCEVNGFIYPNNVIANPYDNGCIVTDAGSGKIMRFSALGKMLSEIGGYYYPRGLAIEYNAN